MDEATGRELPTLREERDHLVAEAEALRRREGERADGSAALGWPEVGG